MKTYLRLLTLTFTITTISSCSTWRKLNDTERGAIIGGGSGAAVGTAIGGGAGGALIGGAAGAVGGGLIGREMDKDDDRPRRRY
jgi:outer membrane lipoprotein SlyB